MNEIDENCKKIEKMMVESIDRLYLSDIEINIRIRLDHMSELQIFLEELRKRK